MEVGENEENLVLITSSFQRSVNKVDESFATCSELL